MKEWTKNNMKLLSKWRASKRALAAAGGCPSISLQRGRSQVTPEQQQPAIEAQSSSGKEEQADDGPMGALSCWPGGAEAASPSKAEAEDGAATDYRPYDEADGGMTSSQKGVNDTAPQKEGSTTNTSTSQQQQQQQQPVCIELFARIRRRSWKKKLLTLLALLTVVPATLDLFVLRTGHVASWIDSFLDWMGEHPLLGVWAYVGALTLTSLVFVPPSVFVFAAGFTFRSVWGSHGGMAIALVASFLGCVIGGLIGFWRARYMTRDLVQVLMRRYPIIRAVDAAVVRNSLRVMVLVRLNPLIPFGVLNYVFGITGVDWAAFLLAMAGIVPWHFLLVFLGASAETVYNESKETTLMGVILIATGIAFCIIGLVITWNFAKKELQKEVDSAPPSTAAAYRLADRKLIPWKSRLRNKPVPSVEDADLRPAGYLLMQCLGKDSRSGDWATEVEYGTEEGDHKYYQTKLDWNEIILDDFS
mmetsp:Transcript_42898/g.91212  ORF Transcript_42898/g.91212 Transcript_42898/m.91212 type:complete len:474 (-) Transcript_42898:303-1724(-)